MSSGNSVLIFFVDDHAQWAARTYGNAEIETPSLDYLAETGIRLDNAFTPTPVCSPARACFLTGRFASQHGIHDFLSSTDPEIHNRDWLAEEQLLPEILGDVGYQTGMIGKWHLGRNDQAHPAFDHWFSLAGDYPYHHHGRIRYCDNGRDVFITGYTTQVLTDKAVSFLRSRDSESPFLLYVGYTSTHSPWAEQPQRLVSKYHGSSFDDIPRHESYRFGRQALESTTVDRSNEQKALAQYYAAVSHIDEAVGRLVDELDAQGLRENTLIIYAADHGLNCGHHAVWGKGNGTLPLNMLEESIRVPLIMSQPGRLHANRVLSEFVDHTDLFQTVLSHCDVQPPAAAENDYPGISFTPLLEDSAASYEGKQIQFGEYGTVRMARTNRYKLVRRYPSYPANLQSKVGEDEFFDLAADPREEVNLNGRAEYQPLIDELSQEIDRFFARYENPHNSGLLGRQLPQHNFTEAWRGEIRERHLPGGSGRSLT